MGPLSKGHGIVLEEGTGRAGPGTPNPVLHESKQLESASKQARDKLELLKRKIWASVLILSTIDKF